MSTTHDVVNVSQDTTRQDMYLLRSELCGVCSSAVQVLGPRSGIRDHGSNACYSTSEEEAG
jgi:hypothetical protein